MRIWLGHPKRVIIKHLSDREIVSWFSKHIKLYSEWNNIDIDNYMPETKEALDIWADYMILGNGTIDQYE